MKNRSIIALCILCLTLLIPMRVQAAQPANEQEAQVMLANAAAIVKGCNVQVVNYSAPVKDGRTRECDGSGVVLALDANTVYIATAAHCLKYEYTQVRLPDGSQYTATIAYKNPAKDVGFLLVDAVQLSPETLAALTPAPGADAAAIGEVPGNLIFAVSSVETPNGIICIGYLDNFSVVYPNNPQQNVLQFYSDATYGSSGGGVYTLDGVWIGSVSGGNNRGKCWAVPYTDIVGEFAGWMNLMALQQQAQQANAA